MDFQEDKEGNAKTPAGAELQKSLNKKPYVVLPFLEADFRETHPFFRRLRLLAEHRWPWRLHATYDETIARALDVFEKVDRDTPLAGLNWFFDHCETISEKTIIMDEKGFDATTITQEDVDNYGI